ncbi:MAG: Spy/CpxP family protein refolding chaperone [Hyphomonadaceae bacterium]|nr:Spy/CpxP family protein refolding chaperone [Hyphomonadaceae bacterium]
MKALWTAALVSAALVGSCQAQSPAPPQGWRAGPYYGPMMSYGYCPGGPTANGGPQQGWYGPGMMGGAGHMMGGPMMGGGASFDSQQTARWLDAARTRIGITRAQEEAWSAYADAVQADRASMLQMHSQMPMMMGSGGSAPDRLQAHVALMAARQASLQQVQVASQVLYQILTAEQRQQADQTLWSGCW